MRLRLLLMASLAWVAWPAVQAAPAGVEIRRTTDGIPHLRAASWRGLGFGVGYVQAQDALCTLAEAFVTYEGRRAWFFGADNRPARDSTFGRPGNLDLDFFFRAFADDAVAARYREANPPALNALIEGFAAGYNRYLTETRAGRASAETRPGEARPGEARPCLRAPWVREIAAEDVYRRLYAGQVAAGYLRFVTEIANASPAATETIAGNDVAGLRARLALPIGGREGLGSNALAFGRQATGADEAVLFGNPHWYWGGPDRFYQMHLTIPGELDVAGVAFLGVPLVMIGFNDRVAWSHTVSAARRFGLFQLRLDAADPTRYRVDGRSEAMARRPVTVEVRGDDGEARSVTRTFYQTRFGPVLDLGRHDAAFGWNRRHAIAIRDVNAENFRIFRNYFHWNRARSLDEFIAIQRREAAVPWVNTVAIGRGDGRVWYGDVGNLPAVPDALRARCAAPLAAAFAGIDALTPFLDGGRAACDWRVETGAAQPGAMPAAALPWLLRDDYVANMNDSYWLSNALRPLEGFPALLGGERRALSLRGRLGHRLALDLLREPAESAAALSRRLMREVLAPRAYSAELFKEQLLGEACANVSTADLATACRVLRGWSNRADADQRGALLWDAFWERLRELPAERFYQVPFSPAAPLATPAEPLAGDGRVAQALAAAVRALKQSGLAPDAALGNGRFVETGGGRLPLYGGCPGAGYFTVACGADGRERLGPDAMANSYLQVVRFGADGVEAHTLLAHGQDESAVEHGGRGSAPVARYARKQWLRFPFREADIARDPALTRLVLRP